MGWLDHSTNNIILDAVLTDYGRQKLAAANESFSITYFSLGDDEVDYRLIKKYGRSVGKEKIEKNTPIFEAITNQNYALKYKLIGMEPDNAALSLIYLPVFQSSLSTVTLSNYAGSTQTSNLVTVTMINNVTLNVTPINEQNFTIEISDRFFSIEGVAGTSIANTASTAATISVGDPNRTAKYNATLTKDAKANTCSFSVQVKPGIDNTTMQIYGKIVIQGGVQRRQITSNLRVTSKKYGTSIDIPVTYTA